MIPVDLVATTVELARARTITARAAGSGGWEPHGMDPRDSLAYALLAEWAVADHLRLPRRESFERDGGTDLVVAGRTVQVKWNQYPAGDFYVEWWCRDGLVADVGVLVTPPRSRAFERFAIRGWLTRDDYRARAHRLAWQRDGMRVGPGVEQRWLRPRAELEPYLLGASQPALF